jgi:hypothetical protein
VVLANIFQPLIDIFGPGRHPYHSRFVAHAAISVSLPL